MKLLTATAVALALAAIPAQAAVPAPVMKVMGAQFYSQCTSPPPGQQATVLAVCEAYVAGIADGLQADGKMCVGPRMTADRLFPVALVLDTKSLNEWRLPGKHSDCYRASSRSTRAAPHRKLEGHPSMTRWSSSRRLLKFHDGCKGCTGTLWHVGAGDLAGFL